MAGLTAARLRSIAGELRTLATTFGNRAVDIGTMRTSARTSLDDADEQWSGPRAMRTLTPVRDYLGRLDPIVLAATTAQTAVTTLATVADEVAAELERAEQLLAAANSLAGVTGDPAVEAEASELRGRATTLEASCAAAWAVACTAQAVALATPTALIRGFAVDTVFADGEQTSAAEYVFIVAQYAALTGTPIDALDPTGRVAAASDDWIELLSTTGIGEMYFAVLETAKQGDVGDADWNLSQSDLAIAAQNPARLRALFDQWADANGIDLDEATLDFLTAQAITGAMLLRAGGEDSYEDIDNRIQERQPGEGAATALAYVTGLTPVVGLNLVQVNGDPAVTNSWWTGLPGSQQRSLETNGPASLGNTDGIPAADRNEVNQAQLDEDIARLEEKRELAERGEGEPLSLVEEQTLENAYAAREVIQEQSRYEDPLNPDEPVVVQLYVYEPAAFGGDGRICVALGDLDTAEHVAVTVPGLLSDATGLDPVTSQRIYGEARFASGESVAVMDWMGYDAPSYSTSESSDVGDQESEAFDIAGVLNQDTARAGAEQLASDVAGINAMRPDDDPHLTVVGNSYGSTTSAIAADEFGLQADDLVLTGSPGAGGAETADDLSMGAGHTYVISGSTDVVTYLGETGGWDLADVAADAIPGVEQMGNDPAEDEFGAVRLRGEYYERNQDVEVEINGVPIELPGDVEGHAHYTDEGSESLFNVAAVVGGEPDLVMEADPRHKEPAFETHSPVDASLDDDLWDWTPGIDFDWSDEDVVEANLFPVDPEGDRVLDPDAYWTHAP